MSWLSAGAGLRYAEQEDDPDEPFVFFRLTCLSREYWIRIDRHYYDNELPYYTYEIHRDDECLLATDWKHTKVYLAAADAIEEIFQRWEAQP